MVIKRGDIHWVDLGPVIDRGPAKRRPVVVVQSDSHNRSRIGTVVVAAITSNTSRSVFPGNVFLPAESTNLSRDSVAVVTELLTLDRERLAPAVGTLPSFIVREIDAALRRVLDL